MGSPGDLVEYTYETLDSLTGGFSAENYIGSTQYGEVFRGKIHEGMETREVVVKRWVKPSNVKTWPRFAARLEAEIKLLTASVLRRHPNMVKLNGYCCENGRFGVVYDLKPVDTVHNLVLQDDFKWLARIKVALEFAVLVECLHGEELLLRNTNAAHLIVDEAFSPRLLDFSLLVGGVFGGIPSRECKWGCVGYADPRLLESGNWSDKTDVFAYGILLLGLIAKRRAYDTSLDSRRGMNDGNTTYYWALKEYNAHSQSKVWGKFKKRKPKSLVHKSFEMDPYFDAGDGITITKLAMDCVGDDPKQRPTMKQVVCCLRELNAVRFYGHIIGIPGEMFEGTG
ncbi:L-type lectin-domain containing receptor kinase VIII.1-like isoform X2 [Rhododendron vialii]|nr:L-type lectin-domain containing receptor kinase VIII.1-like isoform X2 [Rhododendron vialii]